MGSAALSAGADTPPTWSGATATGVAALTDTLAAGPTGQTEMLDPNGVRSVTSGSLSSSYTTGGTAAAFLPDGDSITETVNGLALPLRQRHPGRQRQDQRRLELRGQTPVSCW